MDHDKLIDTIRQAVTDGTPEQKTAGADACRTLLAALAAEPGRPLAPPQPPSPLDVLSKVDPGQALDLFIAKLRAAVPETAQPQPERRRGFKVRLVPVQRGGKR